MITTAGFTSQRQSGDPSVLISDQGMGVISNVRPSAIVEIVEAHRALAVLRLLAKEACHGTANEELLSDLLDAWALGGSRTELQACFSFLEQSGLVTRTRAGEFGIIHLTHQGSEVADGRVRVKGVLPFMVGCPY